MSRTVVAPQGDQSRGFCWQYRPLSILGAETLHRRSGFGFAVRFVGMNEEAASLLEEALEKLQSGDQYDE